MLDRYLVMQACPDIIDDGNILSILCFGKAENIRNLCGLVHYDEVDAFRPILAPWGSHCALFVTYPSGMAEKCPHDAVILGPTAPDGNLWFPSHLMSLGLPIRVAERMSGNIDRSFVAKCAETTYPKIKEDLKTIKNGL